MSAVSFLLKQLGGNVKVSSFDEISQGGTETIIGYFDRSQINFNYNALNDSVSVTIAGDSAFTIPVITGGGVLTISTTLNGSIDIANQNDFDDNYALLFPKLGGGSGSTPNLQQVCDIGNDTNTNILNYKISTDNQDSEIRAAGAVDIDERGIALVSNTLFNTGFLRAIDKAGGVRIISIEGAEGNNLVANFRPTDGVEEVAYLSDLPTIPILVSGGFVSTITAGTNCSVAGAINARFMRIGATVHFFVSIFVTPTLTGIPTDLIFTLPTNTPFPFSAIASGTIVSGTTYNPVYGDQTGSVSANEVVAKFIAPAASSSIIYIQGMYQTD